MTHDKARLATLCGGMIGVGAMIRSFGAPFWGDMRCFLPILGIFAIGPRFRIDLIINTQTPLIDEHTSCVHLLHQTKIMRGNNNRSAGAV